MPAPILDLDKFHRVADLMEHSVSIPGGGRFFVTVPARRPRTRWWQFWRPHPDHYAVYTLIEAPTSERLLRNWLKRLNRPNTTFLHPWEKGAPRVEFSSPAIREALLRVVQDLVQFIDSIREIRENPGDELTFFAQAEANERVPGEPPSVTIQKAFVNGKPAGLDGVTVELPERD